MKRWTGKATKAQRHYIGEKRNMKKWIMLFISLLLVFVACGTGRASRSQSHTDNAAGTESGTGRGERADLNVIDSITNRDFLWGLDFFIQ